MCKGYSEFKFKLLLEFKHLSFKALKPTCSSKYFADPEAGTV